VGEGRFPRHVARPQCRQLCKFRDRCHKAPKKKPSLSQHRFWHHCGDGCAFGPGLNDPFEEAIDDALSSLPADFRAAMSNVENVVEDEPPDGQPLLGLYRGVPLPRRSSTYLSARSACPSESVFIECGPGVGG
jgi:hypothetical protein